MKKRKMNNKLLDRIQLARTLSPVARLTDTRRNPDCRKPTSEVNANPFFDFHRWKLHAVKIAYSIAITGARVKQGYKKPEFVI